MELLSIKELRAKAPEELQAELKKLRQQQFVLKMKQGSEQGVKNHLFPMIRRQIARIKTLLGATNG